MAQKEIILRQCYGKITKLFEINYGTIQGSILGPVLYAIYVSPLFDITELLNFADDNGTKTSREQFF